MRYIAFDLEWNSTPPPEMLRGKNLSLLTRERLNKMNLSDQIPDPDARLDSEIIEIGAVALDEEFHSESEFSERVYPVRQCILNPFVARAIRIRSHDLEKGMSFPAAIDAFYRWCLRGDPTPLPAEDVLLLAWSSSDGQALRANFSYYGMKQNIPFRVINVQRIFMDFCGTKQAFSLQKACELLGIDCTRRFHRARDDAYYTAKIFQYLLTPLRQSLAAERFSLREGMFPKLQSLRARLPQYRSFHWGEAQKESSEILSETLSAGTSSEQVRCGAPADCAAGRASGGTAELASLDAKESANEVPTEEGQDGERWICPELTQDDGTRAADDRGERRAPLREDPLKEGGFRAMRRRESSNARLKKAALLRKRGLPVPALLSEAGAAERHEEDWTGTAAGGEGTSVPARPSAKIGGGEPASSEREVARGRKAHTPPPGVNLPSVQDIEARLESEFLAKAEKLAQEDCLSREDFAALLRYFSQDINLHQRYKKHLDGNLLEEDRFADVFYRRERCPLCRRPLLHGGEMRLHAHRQYRRTLICPEHGEFCFDLSIHSYFSDQVTNPRPLTKKERLFHPLTIGAEARRALSPRSLRVSEARLRFEALRRGLMERDSGTFGVHKRVAAQNELLSLAQHLPKEFCKIARQSFRREVARSLGQSADGEQSGEIRAAACAESASPATSSSRRKIVKKQAIKKAQRQSRIFYEATIKLYQDEDRKGYTPEWRLTGETEPRR